MLARVRRCGMLVAALVAIWPVGGAFAADCRPMLDDFNRAVDAGLEAQAQRQIDAIAKSAECGRYQIAAQLRLAALRLSAAQLLMARGRPVGDYDRLLTAAETAEVLWQASATMGEVRFGERRFADAAQAYDRAIEIIKNERLTPTPPSKFEIEGLIDRAAQSRLLAANATTREGPRFVSAAKDQRDGTLGGVYSRSVRGIRPRVVPVPITFDYAKTSFTGIGEEAARELLNALKEQRPERITLIGHTDIRGSADTNLRLSRARAEAVATFLRENGINVMVDTDGKGANEPMRLSDTSGLSQDDIYALNRRVEWRRD
jgi:outer membrane protein OmpA-like peptidoglycan-associated protein